MCDANDEIVSHLFSLVRSLRVYRHYKKNWFRNQFINF